jgi:tetraacyldisaccharide 4'-kinase
MPDPASSGRWLERRWYGDVPPLLLQPLSAVYGLAVRLRRTCYAHGWLASRSPGVPVVVVGNLTVGGTGKTPLVIWLATALGAAGHRPGIVLRGYGSRVRAARLVGTADAAAEVGDEALLLARRLAVPVAVGTDRVAAARLLARRGCTVVLSDDGLQHLALRREFAVVVIDGARGFGNGALLPAGPLREQPSALDMLDAVVIHGEDAHHVGRGRGTLHMRLLPVSLREVRTEREQSLDALRGASVHAVAGIGHPQRFFAMLRSLGAQPVEHAFPDHHAYRARDLQFDDDRRIVMTEKDAVKCIAFADERTWYLRVAADLPEPDGTRLLRAVLASVSGGGVGRA